MGKRDIKRGSLQRTSEGGGECLTILYKMFVIIVPFAITAFLTMLVSNFVKRLSNMA